MSVKNEIDRISAKVADTYRVLEGLGATMPEERNANNLAATADSIKLLDSGKLMLVDTVTNIPYKIEVVSGKLTMTPIEDQTNVKQYVMTDTETGVMYGIGVTSSKLTMAEVAN